MSGSQLVRGDGLRPQAAGIVFALSGQEASRSGNFIQGNCFYKW